MTDTTQITEGDYISGTGVYKVTEIDESRTEKPYHVEIASEREKHAEAQQSNAGWASTTLIETLGKHIPREGVESISITNGDTLRWETGHRDGSPAKATVTINDDGTVSVESDGLVVPETFADVLTLKCNIASGHATVLSNDD
jgi:hypothetical protein